MFKRIEYTGNTQITSKVTESSTNSTWMAFDKNTDGNCIIERQSAFDPEQTSYSIIRTVDKVTDMMFYNDFIYCCYEDSLLIGEYLSVTNPLTNTQTLSKLISITEQPIGITANSNGIFILMPGISPTDIDVLVFTISGTYDETITLTGLNNAKTITSDNNDEVWVSTNNSPSELIRIFPDGFGSFNTQTTILS